MNALVGYTGFVGSNLYAAGSFDAAYNSKNIQEAYGTKPDLLVYAGVRAEKYLANSFPEKDRELIEQARENIERIRPRKIVLISTIDVLKSPCGADENTPVCTDALQPYGYDRYLLEAWVRQYDPEALIVRLPGLFGKNLKKNFIYDIIHVIPFMLKENKMLELAAACPEIMDYYELQDNGFFRLKPLGEEKKAHVKGLFEGLGFSAVNFTDSRSVFQFYDLRRLWADLQTALQSGIRLLHTAVEPVSAAELYRYVTGRDFCNELPGAPAYYDFRTIHAELFHGKNGYLCDKNAVMQSVKEVMDQL